MKSLKLSSLLLAVIVSGAFAPAFAASPIYVDAVNGSNANSGTTPGVGGAVATINQGISLVTAGGTVIVAAGTYGEKVIINKALTLQGPNAGIDPNVEKTPTPSPRVGEAIILATEEHTNPDTDYNDDYGCVLIDSPNVTVDGFTVEGNNGSINSGVTGPDGTTQVGQMFGIQAGLNTSTFHTVVIKNNIVQNMSQWGVYLSRIDGTLSENNQVLNNRFKNIGVPLIPGYGTGVTFDYNTYARVKGNYFIALRGGIQVQALDTAATVGPADISDNVMSQIEAVGIFMNGQLGNSNLFTIVNNTISGQSTARGFGIGAVSYLDNARFTVAGNTVSNFFNGFYFANNDTGSDPIRISGGAVSNVRYGAVFVNRLGAQGSLDVASSTLTGSDATGGGADFGGTVSAAGLTAGIKVGPGGNLTGASAFSAGFFTGKIALLNTSGTAATTATKNAQNAGAVAVIFARTDSNPAIRVAGTDATVTIPVTQVSKRVADLLRTALLAPANSGTVNVSLNDRYISNSTFGVNEAGTFISRATEVEIVNVRLTNAINGGFLVWDVPRLEGTTTGSVTATVTSGSKISGAPVGILVDGSHAALDGDNLRLQANTVGVEVRNGGSFGGSVCAFESNTSVGLLVTKGSVSLDNADFITEPLSVKVVGTPGSVDINHSNFDAIGTAIENTVPGSGTVSALSNYWGAASGPDDDAGVINGTGARISLGVNAGSFATAPILVLDSDGDGLTDPTEVGLGTLPNDADTDNDGVSDGVEVALGTNPLVAGGAYVDADGDGVPSIYDPNDNNRDSDGDGIADGYEIRRNTLPNNPYDFPLFGDADSNGIVDNVDAVVIIEAFLGIRDFRTVNRAEIDVNLDGRTDNVDAIILFNYQVGNIPFLPYP